MDGRGPCSTKGLSLRTAQVNDVNCAMKTKLLLSIAAFVTGALLGGCKGKSHTTSPPPPLVEVVTVTQADVPLVAVTLLTRQSHDLAQFLERNRAQPGAAR